MERNIFRSVLLAATALSFCAFNATAASAQAAGDQEINTIEQQIRQLQRELQAMKKELARRAAEAKQAQAQAAAAKAAAAKAQAAVAAAPVAGAVGGAAAAMPLAQGGAAPPLVPQQLPPGMAPPPAPNVTVNPAPPPSGEFTITTVPPPPGSDSLYSASPGIITQLAPGYSLRVGGLTITLGGYVESAWVYRNHNETAGIGSGFNTAIPMGNVPSYYMSEIRGDARQSRYAALAQGNVSPTISVAAYLEGDFLSTTPVANSVESSSYNPRWRLYYAQLDDSELGLHGLFGESWSLATMFKSGLTPRQELIPIDPEAQYIVGFTWTRNMTYRIVKSLDDNKINIGLALENPETVYFVGPNGTGVPGTTSYYFPGGPLYASTTNYTVDYAPDVILKAAFDPGFGHYELYGLGRFMQTRTSVGNGGNNHVTMAGGIGGGALVTVLDQALDLYTSFLVGDGIGRYTTSGLPDAVIGPNGNPVPIPGFQVLTGVIGHPNDAIDAYLYIGTEQVSAKYFNLGGKGYGYGSPLYSNVGCWTQNSPVCAANTSGVTEGSIGAWWRFFEGRNIGVFLVGPQYEYVRRVTFKGIGGAPKVNEQIWILSLRYYPFQ